MLACVRGVCVKEWRFRFCARMRRIRGGVLVLMHGFVQCTLSGTCPLRRRPSREEPETDRRGIVDGESRLTSWVVVARGGSAGRTEPPRRCRGGGDEAAVDVVGGGDAVAPGSGSVSTKEGD